MLSTRADRLLGIFSTPIQPMLFCHPIDNKVRSAVYVYTTYCIYLVINYFGFYNNYALRFNFYTP